jgi:hypothetical protein
VLGALVEGRSASNLFGGLEYQESKVSLFPLYLSGRPLSSRSILDVCVMPVLMYGCKNWLLTRVSGEA